MISVSDVEMEVSHSYFKKLRNCFVSVDILCHINMAIWTNKATKRSINDASTILQQIAMLMNKKTPHISAGSYLKKTKIKFK